MPSSVVASRPIIANILPPPSVRRIQLPPQEFFRLSRGVGLVRCHEHICRQKGPRSLLQLRKHSTTTSSCLDKHGATITVLRNLTRSQFVSHSSGRRNLRPFSDSIARRDQDSSHELSQDVKRLMRSVPHPVAVVTATDSIQTSKDSQSTWRGATVSSFNTVTLMPSPVVSFNIKRISSTYDAIESSGHFGVHLLNCNETAVKLASRFSQGNLSSPFVDFEESINAYAKERISEAPSQEHDPRRHPPLIRTGPEIMPEAVSFSLRCRFLRDKAVVIGDHVVVFGEVEQAWEHRDVEMVNDYHAEHSCLAYADGSYRDTNPIDKFESASNPNVAIMAGSVLPDKASDFTSFRAKIQVQADWQSLAFFRRIGTMVMRSSLFTWALTTQRVLSDIRQRLSGCSQATQVNPLFDTSSEQESDRTLILAHSSRGPLRLDHTQRHNFALRPQSIRSRGPASLLKQKNFRNQTITRQSSAYSRRRSYASPRRVDREVQPHQASRESTQQLLHKNIFGMQVAQVSRAAYNNYLEKAWLAYQGFSPLLRTCTEHSLKLVSHLRRLQQLVRYTLELARMPTESSTIQYQLRVPSNGQSSPRSSLPPGSDNRMRSPGPVAQRSQPNPSRDIPNFNYATVRHSEPQAREAILRTATKFELHPGLTKRPPFSTSSTINLESVPRYTTCVRHFSISKPSRNHSPTPPPETRKPIDLSIPFSGLVQVSQHRHQIAKEHLPRGKRSLIQYSITNPREHTLTHSKYATKRLNLDADASCANNTRTRPLVLATPMIHKIRKTRKIRRIKNGPAAEIRNVPHEPDKRTEPAPPLRIRSSNLSRHEFFPHTMTWEPMPKPCIKQINHEPLPIEQVRISREDRVGTALSKHLKYGDFSIPVHKHPLTLVRKQWASMELRIVKHRMLAHRINVDSRHTRWRKVIRTLAEKIPRIIGEETMFVKLDATRTRRQKEEDQIKKGLGKIQQMMQGDTETENEQIKEGAVAVATPILSKEDRMEDVRSGTMLERSKEERITAELYKVRKVMRAESESVRDEDSVQIELDPIQDLMQISSRSRGVAFRSPSVQAAEEDGIGRELDGVRWQTDLKSLDFERSSIQMGVPTKKAAPNPKKAKNKKGGDENDIDTSRDKDLDFIRELMRQEQGLNRISL